MRWRRLNNVDCTHFECGQGLSDLDQRIGDLGQGGWETSQSVGNDVGRADNRRTEAP